MSKDYIGIVEISNTDYHAEKKHLSSSNLKTLLKNPAIFYEEKILGNRKGTSSSTQTNYDEGTYAHSLLLEPHLIEKEFRFFEGWKKQGKDWVNFQEENKGFVLLSKPQKVRVEKWVAKAKKHDVAMKLLSGGKPELALFGELLGINIKVRADYINVDSGYILDIKTTSYPADLDNFKYTAITNYQYHLSAALYLMMFEQYYGKKLDFYFLVLSKSEITCEVFKLSEETRLAGEMLIRSAVDKYKECLKTGEWNNKTVDIVEELDSEYEILEI